MAQCVSITSICQTNQTSRVVIYRISIKYIAKMGKFDAECVAPSYGKFENHLSKLAIIELVKKPIRDFHRSLFFRSFSYTTFLIFHFASASVTLESRYKNEKVDDGSRRANGANFPK